MCTRDEILFGDELKLGQFSDGQFG